jgi:hypothetical protein
MKNFKTSDAIVNPTDEETMAVFGENSWAYGWTHYGRTGQTKARMNKLTHEVEIKERNKWIKCHSGCDEFFTSFTDSLTISTGGYFSVTKRSRKRFSTSAHLAENSHFFAETR